MSNTHKKWCEYCKIMIPYNRAAIQDHEASHKHKKNYEKALRAQHLKARKEHGNFSSVQPNPASNRVQTQNNKRNNRVQVQEPVEQQQEEEEQFLKADDPVADREGFLSGKLWILEREDDTGKLRFRNTLTGKIEYNKPAGLLLEDYEEEEWEKYAQQQTHGPSLEANHKVKIGDWEEVKQGEGFFDKFKAEEESEQEQPQENYLEKLEKKIADGEITRKADVIKELILQGSKDQELFRERLRELAEKDVELNIAMPQQKKEQPSSPTKNTGGLFKKRVTNQKNVVKVVLEEDQYE